MDDHDQTHSAPRRVASKSGAELQPEAPASVTATVRHPVTGKLVEKLNRDPLTGEILPEETSHA